MEKVGYERFYQEVGGIIIAWARAEERFRGLLKHVAGLDGDEGEIVFSHVSALNSRKILVQLAALKYGPEAQNDLQHCTLLHETNAANRNLFAHGHVGFASLDMVTPFAMRMKPHVGKKGVIVRGWNVDWPDVLKIVPAIEAFDAYVAFLIAHLPNDLDPETEYLRIERPAIPTDYTKDPFNLAETFGDRIFED